MEEYEVDLHEYLRMLWRWKWLVVGVVVVSLLAATAASLWMPAVHQAEMVLSQSRDGSFRLPRSYSMPSLETVEYWAMDPPLLARVAEGTPADVQWLGRNTELYIEGDFLRVSTRGQLTLEVQEKLLDRLLRLLNEQLEQELLLLVDAELVRLEDSERRLEERLDELARKLKQLRQQAESKRGELLREIEALEAEITAQGARFGEEMNPEGYIADRRLRSLFGQLEPLEIELDRMDRLGVAYLSAGEVLEIEQSLEEIQAERSTLLTLRENPPQLLTNVMGPAGTGTSTDPSLRLNLSVAGILGLLAAFLLAGLASSISRQRRQSPP